MRCTRCGTYVEPTSLVCAGCGMPLGVAGDQRLLPPAATSSPPGAPTAWAQPAAIPYSPQIAGPATTGNGFSIAAIVCGAVSLVMCPIVLGPTGIVLGFAGRSRGESLAVVGIVLSIVGTAIGILLGVVVALSFTQMGY